MNERLLFLTSPLHTCVQIWSSVCHQYHAYSSLKAAAAGSNPVSAHSKHQKWPNQTGIKQKWQQNGHFRTKQSLTCWMKDKCEWTKPNALIVSRDSPRSCDSIQIRASMSLWHAPNASVSGSIWQKRASGSNPVCRTSKTPKVTTSNRNGYRIAVNSCMFLFTLSLPLFPLSFFPFLSLSLSPQFFFPPPG